jgi:ketosteroid isomerase-like protein
LAPGNPPIQGAESVVETWKAWGALPNVKISFSAERVEAAASGDLAYDYGAYTFAFDSDKGPFAEEGKYIVVWKKIDGAWKIAADIFNNNSTP